MAEDSWPPKSPLKALLSSPSGRRRYQEYKDSTSRSPDRLLGTPSLLDKLRAARAGRDDLILENPQPQDEDEDEETLKLQLAAIEAKLKLKKLQQKKDKQDDAPSETPSSVQVTLSPLKRIETRSVHKSPSRVLLGIDKGLTGADISLKRAKTVGASPSKSRLHRPQSSISSRLLPDRHDTPKNSPLVVKSFSERMSAMRDVENATQQRQDARNSARATAFKIDQNELSSYHDSSDAGRSRQQVDRDLLASHRAQLASNREDSHSHPLSHTKSLSSLRRSPTINQSVPPRPDHTATTPSSTKGDSTLYEGFSRTHLSARILPHTFLKRTLPTTEYTVFRIPDLLKVVHSPSYEIPESSLSTPNFVVFGIIASKSSPLNHKPKFSGLSNNDDDPTKPTSSGNTTLSTSDRAKSKHGSEPNWDDGSNNSKKFLVLTLTDLTWTLDLFLFSTALPRYHRLTPGTLIAILNPAIMPPKPGREDSGCFSLALHSGDNSEDGTQILEIGKAKNLGFCVATKLDGHQCSHWVNKAKAEICEYHLNAQIARTQSSRMGVNASTAGAFGRKKAKDEIGWDGGGSRGKEPYGRHRFVLDSGSRATAFDHDYGRGRGKGVQEKKGKRFDFSTGSQYYIASGLGPSAAQRSAGAGVEMAALGSGGKSAARMLDTDQDDPFLAEGVRSSERDKQARFRKRAEAMQKEREIMKKLGGIGGSAGGEYMRSQTGEIQGGSNIEQDRRKAMVKEMKENILDPGNTAVTGGAKRKAAESVRLSPVKKTRFLTERGIKEAGRDSLGGTRLSLERTAGLANDDDDDDDDLDIV